MVELKTKKTDASVESFLNKIKNDEARRDCVEIAKLMKAVARSSGVEAIDHSISPTRYAVQQLTSQSQSPEPAVLVGYQASWMPRPSVY